MNPRGVSPSALGPCRVLLAAAFLPVFSKPLIGQDVAGHWAPDPEHPDEIFAANILAGAMTAVTRAGAAEGLPDAPAPQAPAPSQNPRPPSSSKPEPGSHAVDSGVIALLPPPISRARLTPKEKFQIYVHQNYGPQNFILPAIQAGFFMRDTPRGYPREWQDGGGAFGRWYGEQIMASTANRTARLLAQVALQEDPRYVPSSSRNALIRTVHALAFTFVDKTDYGRNTFAFSNFAGATAGGFIGMGLLPNGFNDVPHAERRALRGLETIAIRNIITEFRPQWEPILKKLNVPVVLPEWWTRKPSQHP